MIRRYLWILLLVSLTIVDISASAYSWGMEVLLHPESIDLGEVGVGSFKKAQAIMTFAKGERKEWTVNLAEGWLCKGGETLKGTIAHRHPAKINIAMKSSLVPTGENGNHQGLYNVQLHLEFEKNHAIYQKQFSGGHHREGIVFQIGNDLKIIELSFIVIEYALEPILSIFPQRLDFGVLEPGQQAMKKIEITNRGRRALKWKISQGEIPHRKISMQERLSEKIAREGVKKSHKELGYNDGKWVKVFPELGVTTREIDYLQVAVDAATLKTGLHEYLLKVDSNGGEGLIEIYAEVKSSGGAKIMDVYRYSRDNDVLFSTNPQGEARLANFRDFQKEGIAFRLFAPGTPGTTEFYRWYNPRTQSHYYSSVRIEGGKLSNDYVLEGTIGNIATIHLPNTRALYRWQHSVTGRCFFSTDSRGEGITKKGYKYSGIAGYVR